MGLVWGCGSDEGAKPRSGAETINPIAGLLTYKCFTYVG